MITWHGHGHVPPAIIAFFGNLDPSFLDEEKPGASRLVGLKNSDDRLGIFSTPELRAHTRIKGFSPDSAGLSRATSEAHATSPCAEVVDRSVA